MLTSIDTEMSGDIGTDDRTLPLQFDGTWESEITESFRRKNSVGVLLMPPLVGPGNGDKREKTEDLGCGVCQTD